MTIYSRVLELQQHTPEWHEWRSGIKFSASKAGAWLNVSPWKEETPLRAALEMLGSVKKKDLGGNPNARRGNQFEDAFRGAIAAQAGVLIEPACVERVDRPYIIASLDGLDQNGDIWELKLPAATTFKKYWEELQQNPSWAGPPEYVAQQDHQLLVCKDFAKVNHLVIGLTADELAKVPPEFRGAFSEPLYFTRTLSAERELELLELYDYWHAALLGGDALPEADPTRDIYMPDPSEQAVIAAGETALRIDRQMAALKEELKKLDTALDQQVKVITAAMGDFTGALMPNGVRVSQFPRKGAIDMKAALAMYMPKELNVAVILEDFRGETTLQTKVTFPKDGKAKAKKAA